MKNKPIIKQEQVKIILELLINKTSLNGVEIMQFLKSIKETFNIK